MPQQSLGQSRVVDPLLTTMAYGIEVLDYVGHLAFPPVFIPKRKTKIISFGTKKGKYLYATRRAPGANTNRISTGFGDTEVTLYQDAIEAELPVENAEESAGVFDMQQDSAMTAKEALCLRLEFDQMTLLGSLASYPATNRVLLTGANQFSDPTSNVELFIDNAKTAIVAGCAKLPNTMIIGGLKAYNALKRHPRVRDQYHRSTADTITMAMVAAAFDCPNWGISLATWIDPANPGVETPMFDNKIWFGYVPGQGDLPLVSGMNPGLKSDRRKASFGYTYIKEAAGIGDTKTGIIMTAPYYGDNNRTWYFPAIADRLPVITGISAGYLIDNVSA